MGRIQEHPEGRAGRTERFARIVAVVTGGIFVVFGGWAFLAPQSFFDTVAVFDPYNRHFVHDIGAFQIGLGTVLVLSVYLRDALVVSLSGVGVGSALHTLSHVLDRDIGGKPASDIPFFAIITLLLLAAAAGAGTRARSRRG